MNKAELVARVARETGIVQADISRILDATLEAIARSLKKGEAVKLVDFGTFRVTRRRARAAYDPHARQAMRVPARRWPAFTAGKGLKATVRERPERGAARARERRGAG